MSKPVILIAALGRNCAIGRDNGLLWKLAGDLPRFKELTTGRPVVMGRKTFQSIGKPLPGRTNIVLSHDFTMDGVQVAGDLQAALAMAEQAGGPEIMVIGGAQIYAEALPFADKLLLTEVDDAPADADAFFPAFNRQDWQEVSRESIDHAPRFAYVTYQRKPAI